jgi:hypothetical protein
MLENLVYSNLAKDHRDMTLEAYRSNRQTIMCSATIPQRLADCYCTCILYYIHHDNYDVCRQHFAVSCLKNGWTETLPSILHVTPNQLIPAEVDYRLYCI